MLRILKHNGIRFARGELGELAEAWHEENARRSVSPDRSISVYCRGGLHDHCRGRMGRGGRKPCPCSCGHPGLV